MRISDWSSDVCSSDLTLNGFGVRSHNFGIDYLNSFSDRPFLAKRAVPDDPALTVVHRSAQHSWIYTERDSRDGVRNRNDDLAPASACRSGVSRCPEQAPFDRAMNRQMVARGITPGPAPMPHSRHNNTATRSE